MNLQWLHPTGFYIRAHSVVQSPIGFLKDYSGPSTEVHKAPTALEGQLKTIEIKKNPICPLC